MIEINKGVIEDSIIFYGTAMQTTVCMEELAELAQQLSKQLRNKGDKLDLIGEVADVWICLNMICDMYNITEKELQRVIDYKQARQRRRLNKETNNE